MAKNPIRPTDNEARALARKLITSARFAALAVTHDGSPMVTRVAFATDATGTPISLISDLSSHTKALRIDPRCSLLLGEPDERGDPLTHPRITLQSKAELVAKSDDLVAHYLMQQPKAKLYIGFSDFHFVRFAISEAHLNGGFGKAFHLTPKDLLM